MISGIRYVIEDLRLIRNLSDGEWSKQILRLPCGSQWRCSA